ncbi:MAG: hypothetical protein ACYC3U_09155, partial [Georgenia sp.]
MAVPVTLPRWQLLPRVHHTAAARSAIESGRSLLVIGEPGVGKTQLVESVLSQGLPPSVGPVLTVPGAIADDA